MQEIADALPNAELRAQLNNYLAKVLPDRPSQKERRAAAESAIREFPEIIEYFIRLKEETGDLAVANSELQVSETFSIFVEQVRDFVIALWQQSNFYGIGGDTLSETRARVEFMKDLIENKGGHRLFYAKGKPIRRESDLQIIFRFTWFASPSDVSQEVNDGRGPADFKISRGAFDKTIVEFKLAKNPKLKQNLKSQVEIYQKASDAKAGLKVIVYFTEQELVRAQAILNELGLTGKDSIILIDARADNKPSGSTA